MMQSSNPHLATRKCNCFLIQCSINAPYEHKTDIDILAKKKSYRDKDNKVISAPKNITTNLRAKGLYVFPKFEKDEYSRYRDGVRVHIIIYFKG